MNRFFLLDIHTLMFTMSVANLHGGVDDDHAGDQQNKIDNTHQADDDGRMTFKIPNIGAQVMMQFSLPPPPLPTQRL